VRVHYLGSSALGNSFDSERIIFLKKQSVVAVVADSRKLPEGVNPMSAGP